MLILVASAVGHAPIADAQFTNVIRTYEGNGYYEVPYGPDQAFIVAAPGYYGQEGNSEDGGFQQFYLTPVPPPPPPPPNCNCWS
jgi:hypothetical protein